jgi:cytochrome bd ubiquinol oxidase subunit I
MPQCDINVALVTGLRRKKNLTSAYLVFNIRPSFGKKSPFKVNDLYVPFPNQHVPDRQPMGKAQALRQEGIGMKTKQTMVRSQWEQNAYSATLILGLVLLLLPVWAWAQDAAAPADYRALPGIGSRVAVWIVAQIHLYFAAFVLGVPIFAVTVEFIGTRTKDPRYDQLAHEFTKLMSVAFSTTATFGAVLTFFLFGLYPKFMNFLASLFFPTMVVYVLLFFGEGFTLYLYYYGWEAMRQRKGLHLFLGCLLNVFGIALMFIANSWATFMMTPPTGVAEQGAGVGLWTLVDNYAWMPINIHRLLANVAFGGSIAAAYAGFRFLNAHTVEERARYDWMGYIGNFIGVGALIPLPFAGYYLGREIYAYNEQMGISMMGGIFSWLFIIQAVLIGVLFLSANYYLWLGMERIPGAERYRGWIKFLLIILTVCFGVWMTPHSLVASLEEARKMGGAHHPLLGVLGVMSAKNTAVNLMILTTFLSFMLYKRANKVPTVPWARTGNAVEALIFALAAVIVIFYGIYGYFVPAIIRIGFSVYQVGAVLFTLVAITVIDIFLLKNAQILGEIQWGKIPERAQYALFLLALSFTWLMGLMGYVRSGLRMDWHVYGVMRDTSPGAYTPTLGFATNMVSLTVIIFLGMLAFIFWLGSLDEVHAAEEELDKDIEAAFRPPLRPRPVPGSPGADAEG